MATDLTLNGRIRVEPRVTEPKVARAKELYEGYRRGDRIAKATLSEAMSTSDAIYSVAYLANVNFLPNYDEAPRVWSQIAGRRTVNDFRPATLWSLNRSWTDGNGDSNVLSANGGAPTIPEGTDYPYAYITGETSEGAGVTKKGFKTDWTLEAQINDDLGVIDSLPTEMSSVALDTEEEEVLGALVAAMTSSNDLTGGTIPTGTTVAANAPLSRDALIRAKYELSQREINGRKIVVTGGFNLIVPIGQGDFAQFILNQTYAEVADGSFQLNISGYNPLAGITVVESEYVSGTVWALVPKPGATRRPVVDKLFLRGYETPQIAVDNRTGVPVGGGSISPFEGSFDRDVITLRLRAFGAGVVWDSGAGFVWSDGSGS